MSGDIDLTDTWLSIGRVGMCVTITGVQYFPGFRPVLQADIETFRLFELRIVLPCGRSSRMGKHLKGNFTQKICPAIVNQGFYRQTNLLRGEIQTLAKAAPYNLSPGSWIDEPGRKYTGALIGIAAAITAGKAVLGKHLCKIKVSTSGLEYRNAGL